MGYPKKEFINGGNNFMIPKMCQSCAKREEYKHPISTMRCREFRVLVVRPTVINGISTPIGYDFQKLEEIDAKRCDYKKFSINCFFEKYLFMIKLIRDKRKNPENYI